MTVYKNVSYRELESMKIELNHQNGIDAQEHQELMDDFSYFLLRNSWGRGNHVTYSYELVCKGIDGWKNVLQNKHSAAAYAEKIDRDHKQGLLSMLWDKSTSKIHRMKNWNPHITAMV